jgi:hypothetical protein
MQGKSLFAGLPKFTKQENGIYESNEAILRERLSGLGYLDYRSIGLGGKNIW